MFRSSWRQHPTRHQLYGHLPPITKTIQVRRTKHAGHCWKSREELIRDVLLWTPTYGRAKAGWPARTYVQQLCEDTGCSPEDLLETMNDKEKWRERVWDIRACGKTWWWWWWLGYLNFIYKACRIFYFLTLLSVWRISIRCIKTIMFFICWLMHLESERSRMCLLDRHTHTHTHIYIYIYIYIYI